MTQLVPKMVTDSNDSPRRRSRRHHVVPRTYLRAWADDDDFVGVFDVQTQERRRLHINHVAVRRDANTFEMIDVGQSDEWEVEISAIENLAAPILRSIVVDGNWPLDEEPRGILANFIALQTARAPGLRRSMNEASTQVARMMQSIIAAQPDEQLRATAREASGEELDDDELAALREVMLRGDVIVTHHNNDTMVLFQASAELLQPIADMRWTLLDSEEPGYITSDQPIVHWPHEGQAAWMPVGPLNAAYSTFPISPRHALQMEFVWAEGESPELVIGQPDERRLATSDEVAAINDETYRHADRQVVYVWATTRFR